MSKNNLENLCANDFTEEFSFDMCHATYNLYYGYRG